jgi:hypothetical protein
MASRELEKASQNSGGVVESILETHRKLFLTGHIFLALILFLWPWIFAAVVWGHRDQGGIRAPPHITNLVLSHPHVVDFFFTVISGIIAAIMTHVFTTAVMCVYLDRSSVGANKLLTRCYQHLKSSPNSFPVAEVWRAMKNYERSFLLLFTLTTFASIFTFVGPGFNAILIPHAFSRNAPLHGTEFDFSSTHDDCVAWINANAIPDECGWYVSAINIHPVDVSLAHVLSRATMGFNILTALEGARYLTFSGLAATMYANLVMIAGSCC